jgi:hypothetical protein
MSSKDNENVSSNRYVATISGLELAEKVRKELIWCTKSILSVYLYFDNSIAEDDRIYDIYVSNEIGTYLDDNRYEIACAAADKVLDE